VESDEKVTKEQIVDEPQPKKMPKRPATPSRPAVVLTSRAAVRASEDRAREDQEIEEDWSTTTFETDVVGGIEREP